MNLSSRRTLPSIILAAIFTSLFLALQLPVALSAALPKPVAQDYPDVSEEQASVNIECDPIPEAMWYRFYLQKDGKLVRDQWIRGDDAGLPEDSVPVLRLGILPPGNYRFWVQAWEPITGASPWSDPDNFEVICRTLFPCNPAYPRAGNLPESGYWPIQYVFNDGVINPTATWGQFEIAPLVGGVLFEARTERVQKWVEYDYPGQNGIRFSDVPNLERFLSDGAYDWRCREYSPCFGIGPWSELAWGDIDGTDCSGPPTVAFVLQTAAEHLFHRSSNTSGTGSTPAFSIDFIGTTWRELYIRNIATKKVAYQKWIFFSDQEYNLAMPKLSPGDYEVWSRAYHHDCGTGEWLQHDGFTVQGVGEFLVSFNSSWINRAGHSYVLFGERIGERMQPGVDWYQIVVTCGGRVVMNQWVDLEKRTRIEGENGVFTYDGSYGLNGQIIYLDQPCGGPVTFWVRPYSNAGRYGEWVSQEASEFFPFDGAAPTGLTLNLSGEDYTFLWSQPGGYRGQFEIYVSRNGKLYLQDTVETRLPPRESPAFPYGSPGGVDNQGELPLSYTSFVDFGPGNYRIWVRNVCGTAKGAWSEPDDFAVGD